MAGGAKLRTDLKFKILTLVLRLRVKFKINLFEFMCLSGEIL